MLQNSASMIDILARFRVFRHTYNDSNPLDSKGNYSATSNNMKFVHWPLMGGLLHLVQREGAWVVWGPAQSPRRCTKCNSPPITGKCTNRCIAIHGPLFCGYTM